jgi:hypothetical protein
MEGCYGKVNKKKMTGVGSGSLIGILKRLLNGTYSPSPVLFVWLVLLVAAAKIPSEDQALAAGT